jgi:hypothetical protein
MAKLTMPSVARLKEIYARQGVRRWHSNYQAAIRANRWEAPAHSRPSSVPAPRFGRRLHALSIPEARAFRIAHYLPNVVEVLEQYVLPTTPVPHFLTGSPFDPGTQLPHYRGTVAVAEELGVLKFHPIVRSGEQLIPFPFIGDLLVLFWRGAVVEVVNISIKAAPQDFERPYQAGPQAANPEKAIERVRARHAVEETLHLDAGIQTIRFTPEECTGEFHRNLEWLHTWAYRNTDLSEDEEARIGDALFEALEKGQPPISTILTQVKILELGLEDGKTALARSILSRRLSVEIESGLLLLDQPLQKEIRNPQDAFSRWFGAGR